MIHLYFWNFYPKSFCVTSKLIVDKICVRETKFRFSKGSMNYKYPSLAVLCHRDLIPIKSCNSAVCFCQTLVLISSLLSSSHEYVCKFIVEHHMNMYVNLSWNITWICMQIYHGTSHEYVCKFIMEQKMWWPCRLFEGQGGVVVWGDGILMKTYKFGENVCWYNFLCPILVYQHCFQHCFVLNSHKNIMTMNEETI